MFYKGCKCKLSWVWFLLSILHVIDRARVNFNVSLRQTDSTTHKHCEHALCGDHNNQLYGIVMDGTNIWTKLAIEIFVYSSVLMYLNPLFCPLLYALLHAGLSIKGPFFVVFFVLIIFPSLITVAQLSSTVESTAQTLNRSSIIAILLPAIANNFPYQHSCTINH